MKQQLVAVFVLTLVVAFVGSGLAQGGMMGPGTGASQVPTGQTPQPGGEKPSEQPSALPTTPEFAARMMNACIGAMEGMAQMGRMMGGQGGTAQTPSEKTQ